MRNLSASLSLAHTPTPEVDLTHGAFDIFRDIVAANLARFGQQQLFTTNVDADDLFQTYLRKLPAGQQQHHTCNCCKAFFRRYAGLVFIDDAGRTRSAFWDFHHNTPQIYDNVATTLQSMVERAVVTGAFFSSDKEWGNSRTGFWTHFGVRNPNVLAPGVMSADEQIALKKEHFGTVTRALAEFPLDLTEKAVALLSAEALWRGEKVLGAAQFLNNLQRSLKGIRAKAARNNTIWAAIARAPAGFCTPRSGMIGTLLEDLAAGKSIETVKLNFAAKMDPTKYQRPTAAASSGNIAQAEKLVDRTGIKRSLARRHAVLHEVSPVWLPSSPRRPRRAPTGGVFSGLLQEPPVRALRGETMTWVKFARTILPQAAKIELEVPRGATSFGALVTAVNPDAPMIFQWDGPLSWYLYSGGSLATAWSLRGGEFTDVLGVANRPGSELPHQGAGAMLVLKGARDVRTAGLALFPEIMRSDLHAVRKTIEQYSRTERMQPAPGHDPVRAQGLILTSKAFSPIHLRVTTAAGVFLYTVDRWD